MSEERKAGDAWKNHIKQYSQLEQVWFSIPEPTNILLSQQIDIFAGKYPVKAEPVKPVDEWKDVDTINEAQGRFKDVEVLFDDGSILGYMDENWPFAVSVKWRFKTPSPVNPSLQSGMEDAAKEYCKDIKHPYNFNLHQQREECFKAGAEWQAKQVKPVMQWVKVSERQPEFEGDYYVVRTNLLKEVMYHTGSKTSNSRWRENVIEWLEEPIQ